MNRTDLVSYSYFQTLFDKARENSILILDSSGIIVAVNNSFTSCFGYAAGDLIGKKGSILFTPEDQQKGLPEKELNKTINEGQAADNNYLVKKDNTITWVSGESIAVKNDKGDLHILKVIQDINEQKISEVSLHILNNYNESILRSIEDMVIVLNEKLDIVTANNAFFRFFKYDINAGDRLNFEGLLNPFDPKNEIVYLIRKTFKDNTGFMNYPVEIKLFKSDTRIFDIRCSPLLHTSDKNNVLVILHDITEKKQAEREREDIIGFVAHELRNPLANIILCNEIMSEAIKENKTGELDSLLSRTKNNVLRLNKMISELYDATRINSGNFVLEQSSFQLKEMIEEAVDTIKILQPSYNIIVRGESDIIISGDRYRLMQVITNYLSNGIKYSNGNSDVYLNILHDKNWVTISVKDKGLGISKEHLPHIFERFFRAEKTKNLEGIGLGLYLCSQIIQQHNGKVWAETEEGKGSTFYFSIPINGIPVVLCK